MKNHLLIMALLQILWNYLNTLFFRRIICKNDNYHISSLRIFVSLS